MSSAGKSADRDFFLVLREKTLSVGVASYATLAADQMLKMMYFRCCVLALTILFLNIDGVEAQSLAHERCNGFDKGLNISNWLEEYWNNDWPQPHKYTKADLELMLEAGITSIRLPINFHAVTDTVAPYTVDTDHIVFDLVDSVIQWTEELDMKLLIDNHHGWALADNTWRADLPRFSHLWSVLAERYKVLDPDRVVFELLNEPALFFSGDSLMIMYEDAIDSIRQHTVEHSIIVSPHWGGTGMVYAEFEPLEDTNLIYTWHSYDPLDFTHQGLPWQVPYFEDGNIFPHADTTFSEMWLYTGWERVLNWRQTHGRPVFLGEFGLSSYCDSASVCNWLQFTGTKLIQNDISWFYWDWRWDFPMFRSNVISEDSINPCFKYYLGLYGDDTFTDVPMIDKELREHNISVYPNPSDGSFTIELAVPSSFEMSLYDSFGRLVRTRSDVSGEMQVNGSLVPGIYLVVLRSEETRFVERIVIH